MPRKTQTTICERFTLLSAFADTIQGDDVKSLSNLWNLKKQLITSSGTAVHFSSIIWCSSKINITVNVNLWNDIHHVVQIVIQIKLVLPFSSLVHNTISQDEIENWIIKFFLNYHQHKVGTSVNYYVPIISLDNKFDGKHYTIF